MSTKLLNQFTIVIPGDMTRPKYAPGDQVTWQRLNVTFTGVIVGLLWVDDTTAVMEQITPGWHYAVSQVYGVSDATTLIGVDGTHTYLCEGSFEVVS